MEDTKGNLDQFNALLRDPTDEELQAKDIVDANGKPFVADKVSDEEERKWLNIHNDFLFTVIR